VKEIIKKYWHEFKLGTKTMFKEFSNKETNKKQRANMWTFTRLIIPVITVNLSIIAIITNFIPFFIATACVAGFGALTDKFDGAAARKYQSNSEYGKLLDQITDKSFAGIIGINLLFLNPSYIFVLLGEALISLVNISYKLKYKDININSTYMGKAKQIPLFLSLALGYLSTINHTLLLVSNLSILITIVFQLATTTSYIKNNNKSVKELKKNSEKIIIKELGENYNKNNVKVKTKILENKNIKYNDKNISKIEQCQRLKKLKDELINNTEIEENNYQKSKK